MSEERDIRVQIATIRNAAADLEPGRTLGAGGMGEVREVEALARRFAEKEQRVAELESDNAELRHRLEVSGR